jgi:hypothetical protein
MSSTKATMEVVGEKRYENWRFFLLFRKVIIGYVCFMKYAQNNAVHISWKFQQVPISGKRELEFAGIFWDFLGF